MSKLNLEFYKEDIEYDTIVNKQEENDIIQYINKYKEDDYEKIFENDLKVPVFINLSDIRNNIINWYPFKENSDVLEIGASFGSVTGELCKKCKNVTSVEFIKSRAEAIRKRHEDKDNLEIICGRLEDISFDKKFDYITLFGVIEYSSILYKDINDPVFRLIETCKKLLKEDGHILIATNNKFGVKQFSGSINNENEEMFSNIFSNKLYTKSELENIFKKCNLENFKFFYLLPNYNAINVIYSDKYLPNINDTKLLYNLQYNEYENIVMNEINLLKEFTKNNLFKEFCNSYFIDIGSDSDDPRFVGYNNIRKDKYRLITKIYDNYVIKESINSISDSHIATINSNIIKLKKSGFDVIDEVKDKKVYSKFLEYDKLDKIITNYIISYNTEEAIKLMGRYFEYIKSKLELSSENNNIFNKYNIKIGDETLKNLTIIKDGFMDLVFENVFYDTIEFIIFDQEWYFENIPLEFIYYRAIKNMYAYNFQLESIISRVKLYDIFKINDYITLFEQLEEKLQQEISDTNKIKLYSKSYSRLLNVNNLINQNKINIDIINDLNRQIEKVSDDIRNICSENDRLNQLQKETSFKLEKTVDYKLNKFFSKLKKNK